MTFIDHLFMPPGVDFDIAGGQNVKCPPSACSPTPVTGITLIGALHLTLTLIISLFSFIKQKCHIGLNTCEKWFKFSQPGATNFLML